MAECSQLSTRLLKLDAAIDRVAATQASTDDGELQVSSYKLQATSYKLQVTSYKLQVTSYKLQATSYKLQVARYKVSAIQDPASPGAHLTDQQYTDADGSLVREI